MPFPDAQLEARTLGPILGKAFNGKGETFEALCRTAGGIPSGFMPEDFLMIHFAPRFVDSKLHVPEKGGCDCAEQTKYTSLAKLAYKNSYHLCRTCNDRLNAICWEMMRKSIIKGNLPWGTRIARFDHEILRKTIPWGKSGWFGIQMCSWLLAVTQVPGHAASGNPIES